MKRGPLALLLALALPAAAEEVDLAGRISLRGLYSTDDGQDTPDVAMLFLDTDARAENLTDGGLRLVLDATFLLDATEAQERRFGRTESIDQVRQLYAELPRLFGRLDLAAGRKLLPEAGNAWVDGVDLEWWFGSDASLGAYGGLRPEPIEYALTLDYQALGAYGTVHGPGFDGSLAYNVVLFEGALDRQFAFNRMHWEIVERLFLATYLVVDFTEEVEVTTLLATLDYTPVQALNLSLNYTRYSVEQYRNEQIYRNVIEPNQILILGDEVFDLVYDRARVSASLRFGGHYVHYQSFEYKHRSQDDLDAWLYTVGLRDENLFGLWGTYADLRVTARNNFQSDSYLVALEIDQDLGAHWSVGGRFTWFNGRTVGRAVDERSRTFDEAQEIFLVGASVGWRPHASHHLDLHYDGIYEAELQDARNQDNLFIHTGMARYAYLF